MSYEYAEYLYAHRANVEKGWLWLKDHLRDQIYDAIKDIYGETSQDGHAGRYPWIEFADVDELVRCHDESKSDPEEYHPYDIYFYGGNRSHQVVADFHRAFLLHIHKNPHHWQYWVLIHDEPDEKFEAIEMPIIYILEMICDWWSFSWKKGDLTEVFSWWDQHKDYILLEKKSRKFVERILEEMKKELETEDAKNESLSM